MSARRKLNPLGLARSRPWVVVPFVVVLLLLDALPPLRGVPLLLVTIFIASFASDGLPRLFRRKELQPLCQVSSLVAILVLLSVFCYRRDLPQFLLLLVTAGVVVAILLVILALIGDVSKRGLLGLRDFLVMAALGLLLGAMLSSLLFLRPPPLDPPGAEGARPAAAQAESRPDPTLRGLRY